MNKRRLLKLADLLEADAKNEKGIKFDIGTVGEHSGGKRFVSGVREPSLSCGTTACAMGLAALSGTFSHEGLSYLISAHGEIECAFNGCSTFYADAAARLFDITGDEAYFLFSPSRYRASEPTEGATGERYVAKRIRDFVAGKATP